MPSFQLYAGPRARQHLRERGLRPQDVAVVAGAAAGPKGLVLTPLDRYLFGEWFRRRATPLHLIGASIGAWRFAHACLADPDAALRRLAHDYIHESYAHPSGGWPPAAHVSAVMARRLTQHFAGREPEVLGNPDYRLHVFTSRGHHPWLRRGTRVGTWAGYAGALAANAVARRSLGRWLDRVVFSDPRDRLPVPLDDLPTTEVALTRENLQPAILASCSIPFWLEPVRDPPGAPPGAYWDGGITDYHLHLDYAAVAAAPDAPSLVLFPHLQPSVVPGWLDKWLAHRHVATPALDNVVLVVPDEAWARTLPGGKVPDRTDFRRYRDDEAARVRVWTRAVAESERLAAEFAALVERGGAIDARPLAGERRALSGA
jgi:hypothetical protein